MEPPHARPLRRADLDPDPLRQFRRWFEEARAHVDVPEAMVVATATREGAPSARFVLLKGFDEDGFVFYSNWWSRKGRELAENPRAALLFHWRELGRQVRIEGAVSLVDPAESEAYFRTRPRGAQLSAWASAQSEPVGSREELEARVAEVGARFAGGEVPLPPHWGGYRVSPAELEFWQHRDDRLHDRFRYRRAGGGWQLGRLQP